MDFYDNVAVESVRGRETNQNVRRKGSMKARKNHRSVYRRENTVFASPSCSQQEEEVEVKVEVVLKGGKRDVCADELPL